VVVLGLLAALPVVAAAERLRAGSGRRVARLAIRGVSRACGIRYTITGLERLDPSVAYVFVPNHSSPVDIPTLLVVRPDLRFVAAAELFRVPLLSSAMRALGAVPIDRSRTVEARRRLAAIVEDARTDALVVFAEGGIPAPGEPVRFETGAFVLAIEAGVPVVPVSIRGSADVLPRGQRIWVRPGEITVKLHDPIDTAGCTLADRKQLRDRTERIVRTGR
jgi:1-acyl-sn-glycerol-3-phosphate acyltransferase